MNLNLRRLVYPEQRCSLIRLMGSHGPKSQRLLYEASLSAEELANHGVHLHGLFFLDLLVGPQDDTDGEQETRS